MTTRGDVLVRARGLLADALTLQVLVDSTLRNYAAAGGYLYWSRVKSIDSLLQKLDTGRFPSLEVEDLLACTIVVKHPGQVRPCVDNLPAAVEVLAERGPEGRDKDPQVFRFDERILTCRMPSVGEQTEDDPRRLSFELQVQTVTTYAWGQATHDLVYKGRAYDWSRVRLAAQLRAIAEQVDLMYSQFDELVASIHPSQWKSSGKLAVASKFLQESLSDGSVPSTQAPESGVRFAESVVELAEHVGVDVDDLCAAVSAYLGATPFPISLTLYEVVLGVACSKWAPTTWRARRPRYFVVTADLIAQFAAADEIRPEARVLLGGGDTTVVGHNE